ncbi:MAG TPA: peptidoglycan-binding protein [Propionicimonas sp.]|nr:peptidoglycan-binding protein [Propionicimonas sp.]HRA05653.1 peptidoglycan-binding protein [Propionicimonas sp.]
MAISLVMLIGLALVDPASASAISTNAKKSFISSLVVSAQAAQRQYGVPASVAIAEAIVDSNWGTSKAAKQGRNYFNTACRATMTAAQFAKLAEAQVGKPYVLGAEAAISQSSPAKFDCSELVEWLYGRSGNRITDLAASQYNVTRAVSIDAPQVGDLVFLRNNPARSNGIGHVAVVTKKLASGEWEIVEARGRAAGVVTTTLSYWKDRKYFAGLRRYDGFFLADDSGVKLDATANAFQYGCVSVTEGGATTRYSNYSSIGNAFADRAAIIASAEKYAGARAVLDNVNSFVDELAKADRGDSAGSYAQSLRDLITGYKLNDYDVVPFTVVLSANSAGAKVTALQYLLRKAGVNVKATGAYDAATKAAVKKFQAAKKLDSDGEAGPVTLTALAPQLKSGASGDQVRALHALLNGFGYATNAGKKLGSTTVSAVKAFQTAVGLSASGIVTANTWAKLFMAVDPAPVPTVTGTNTVDATLTVDPGTWAASAALSYQWFRGAAPISGANGATYQVQPADVGSALLVTVTGSLAPYTPITRVSAATAAIVPGTFTATPAPTISGTPAVGQELTAVTDGWGPGEVAFTYQWFRGKSAIKAATGRTYVAQTADLGAKLTVRVVGSRAGYTAVTQVSAELAEVAKGELAATEPALSGKAKVGKKLTVAPGKWATVKVSFSYQWFRNDTRIKGANKASYKVTKSDKGKVLTVAVTGKATGFNAVEKRVSSAKVS